MITKGDNCRGLLESGSVSHEEIAYANDIVLNKHMPVCIHKDGVILFDDVGGLSGFADFLGTVYESDELRAWGKSLGWSEKKTASKRIL